MKKTPCKNCVPPKRYLGCHDKCPEYLETKPKYNNGVNDEIQTYIVDKHYSMKRKYGGR